MHPVQATSNSLSGSVDVELDDQGTPNLDAPYGARLRLPVESIKSGHGLQDREMYRRLDNRKYPDIGVELTGVESSDDHGHYKARAKITVRGQTREVDGEVDVIVDGDRLVVEGERSFDMRDFGMEPPRILMLKVEPDVMVRVRITAERQA